MIDLLILLVINSLVCFGFWNACLFERLPDKWDDRKSIVVEQYNKGVLWFVEKWSNDKWFYKPLCGCLPCMASLHSVYPYWILMFVSDEMNLKSILFYQIYIVALSGLNYLIESVR